MKKHSFKILLLMVLFVFVTCKEDDYVPDLEGVIKGRAVQDWDDEPVLDAKITTSPSSKTVYTDADGNFIIEEVPIGDYSISIVKDGFSSWTEKVTVYEDEISVVKFFLEATTISNPAEDALKIKSPVDGALKQPLSIQFEWSFLKESYKGEKLSVSLYTIDNATLAEKLAVEKSADTLFVASGFRFNGSYSWYLKLYAEDVYIGQTKMSRFETMDIPEDILVFTRKVDANYEIFALDTLGEQTYQLTNHPAKDWFPRKSPVSNDIAFVSDRESNNHIYLMNPDGTNVRKVSRLPVSGYNNPGIGFAWSPDGGYIIYPNYDKLIKINKEGYGEQVLATAPVGRHFGFCDWSKYGNKIVVQTVGQNIYESEIYIMNSDGTDMKIIVADLPGRTESPIVSMDGKLVYFTNDSGGLNAWDGLQLDNRIYQINADGTNMVELTDAKDAGQTIWNLKLLHTGAGLIYSTGKGLLTDRDIRIRYFNQGAGNPGSTSSIGTIKNGDMPDM